MAYNSNIPQPTDPKSQSQGEMLANFTEINTFVDVDHGAFNGADQGKHKRLNMVTNAAPGFAAGEAGFYRNIFTSGGFTTANEEIIYRDTAGNEFPTTASGVNTGQRWSFISSGLLIKFGTVNIAAGTDTFNYPVAGDVPVFSSVFSVNISLQNPIVGDVDAAVRIISTTATSIQVFTSNRTTTGAASGGQAMFYMAIGTI